MGVMNYQETRNEIEQTFGSVPGFFNGVPQDVLVQMWPVMKTYIFSQTRIPAKYREMISLAVAATLKCPYCETFHRAASKMNGATDEELAELGAIVGQVTFWSSVLHTLNYDMNTFMKEFQAMGEHFAKQHEASAPTPSTG
jgi:AhpD family alkylhydroperoxidase